MSTKLVRQKLKDTICWLCLWVRAEMETCNTLFNTRNGSVMIRASIKEEQGKYITTHQHVSADKEKELLDTHINVEYKDSTCVLIEEEKLHLDINAAHFISEQSRKHITLLLKLHQTSFAWITIFFKSIWLFNMLLMLQQKPLSVPCLQVLFLHIKISKPISKQEKKTPEECTWQLKVNVTRQQRGRR